jgi:hypothetical protein
MKIEETIDFTGWLTLSKRGATLHVTNSWQSRYPRNAALATNLIRTTPFHTEKPVAQHSNC